MDIVSMINHCIGDNDLTRIIAAIAILLFFLALKKVFAKYIIKIIKKFTSKTSTQVDDLLLQSFERPLKGLFIIFGIFIALGVLPITLINPVTKQSIIMFLRVTVILFITWGLYNFSSSSSILFNGLQKRLGFDFNNAIGPFISNILKFVIISLAVVLVISELGYDISGFIAGLGLSGLAFALAAQETASSIFGGIVILIDKPFAIGDWIQTPSVEGVVEDITLRSTRIRTFANAQSVMPNATLAKEPITNWSRMGKRRITFRIGVTYSTKREKIQACIKQMREMLTEHESVHKETVFVYFDQFNDSSLDIFLYFFTVTTNWQKFLEVKEDINYKIMDILEKEDVNFAFPSRSIYIEQEEKEK